MRPQSANVLVPAGGGDGPYPLRTALLSTSALPSPVPMVLTLGSGHTPIEAELVGYDNQSWWGGITNQWRDSQDESLGCLVEYTAGGVTSFAFMDWIPGTYQLPPCERVDLTIFSRLDSEERLRAVVSEGSFPLARVPTLTGSRVYALAESSELRVPPKAKALEVWATTAVNMTVANAGGFGRLVRRDYASLIYAPPWSPVELDEQSLGGTLSVTAAAACTAVVRFMLGL